MLSQDLHDVFMGNVDEEAKRLCPRVDQVRGLDLDRPRFVSVALEGEAATCARRDASLQGRSAPSFGSPSVQRADIAWEARVQSRWRAQPLRPAGRLR